MIIEPTIAALPHGRRFADEQTNTDFEYQVKIASLAGIPAMRGEILKIARRYCTYSNELLAAGQ